MRGRKKVSGITDVSEGSSSDCEKKNRGIFFPSKQKVKEGGPKKTCRTDLGGVVAALPRRKKNLCSTTTIRTYYRRGGKK